MRVALLALALGLTGCFGSGDCPCGRSWEGDEREGLLSVGADHAPSVHCICRCGEDGDEILEPPATSCARYEGECRGPGGVPAEYTCR
ncbi:MAG TPA: hypothetical protein RMG95_26970 [Polyangiaceae bacterium LLY-WYZ-15_(1-7)]|nr:hypothetical protein [Polyangiaceae bacterium LLY-WYZ-15_(1-7)]HJL44528.1 hypothetical protein [Polyangiaceae bacterium LLY-WYZ-15_(1-7)]